MLGTDMLFKSVALHMTVPLTVIDGFFVDEAELAIEEAPRWLRASIQDGMHMLLVMSLALIQLEKPLIVPCAVL